MKNEIQNFISKGNIESALDLLIKHIGNDAILLQARYNQANHQKNMGTIDYGEWSRVQAQINYAVLDLANKIKSNSTEMVITNIVINFNNTSKINDLDIKDLSEILQNSFKNEPDLLDKLFNILDPINAKINRNQMLGLNEVSNAKAELIKLIQDYNANKEISKKQLAEKTLQPIIDNLGNNPSEEDIQEAADHLEVFLIKEGLVRSNLNKKVKDKFDSEDYKLLKKFNEHRDILMNFRKEIVEIINRVINNL